MSTTTLLPVGARAGHPVAAALLLLTFSVSSPARAVTITATEGPPTLGLVVLDSEQVVGLTWTSSETYANVSISAAIFNYNTPSGVATSAFLTTAAGPGTTPADQVAATVFNAPFTLEGVPQGPNTTIFSGLNLGPGTYYLVLSVPRGFTAGWNESNAPVKTVGPGVTSVNGLFANTNGLGQIDPNYAPASTFFANPNSRLRYSVNGDLVEVPEPQVWLPAAFLVASLALLRRQVRR